MKGFLTFRTSWFSLKGTKATGNTPPPPPPPHTHIEIRRLCWCAFERAQSISQVSHHVAFLYQRTTLIVVLVYVIWEFFVQAEAVDEAKLCVPKSDGNYPVLPYRSNIGTKLLLDNCSQAEYKSVANYYCHTLGNSTHMTVHSHSHPSKRTYHDKGRDFDSQMPRSPWQLPGLPADIPNISIYVSRSELICQPTTHLRHAAS